MENEDKKVEESAEAGSSETKNFDPNSFGNSGGESKKEKDPKASEEMVPKSQYTELEKKLGEQGKELGDARHEVEEYTDFINKILPTLEKLDERPDIVKAINDGKLDSDLIKAVYDGKVSIGDAKVITEAKKEVKEDLGDSAKNMSASEIEALIEKKAQEIFDKADKKLSQGFSEAEQLREYEKQITSFIESTPDFEEHSKDIDEWFKSHPDIYDIEIAYNAVVGKKLREKISKSDAEKEGEAKKGVAANATGGESRNSDIKDKSKIGIESFIGGGIGDPNHF